MSVTNSRPVAGSSTRVIARAAPPLRSGSEANSRRVTTMTPSPAVIGWGKGLLVCPGGSGSCGAGCWAGLGFAAVASSIARRAGVIRIWVIGGIYRPRLVRPAELAWSEFRQPLTGWRLRMDQSTLQRRVRLLSLYAFSSSAVLLVLVASAFVKPGPQRFQTIDVDRINVVGPDGKYAVVISNADRMPGIVMNGRERKDGRRGAGLLFYNADGNEAGGLIFDTELGDSGVRAFGQLSLDRFESDQVAALRYIESPDGWEAGLQVAHHAKHSMAEWQAARDTIDQLPTPAARDSALGQLRRRFFAARKWEIQRLFAGERGSSAVLELRDMRGRQRLRMVVDSLGAARLEFLDATGKVVRSLSEN